MVHSGNHWSERRRLQGRNKKLDVGKNIVMISTLNYIINKYNLNIGKQYMVEIPNMGRADLAVLFAELNFKKGAEIGVERGLYSEILCKANPKLHLYSIDPWKVSAYEPGIQGIYYDQKMFDDFYKETKKRLKPYNCTIIRKTSMKAAGKFPDESLDFVYIDGNHDFVNVTNDIYTWSKKVRPGGIISGHDYIYLPTRKQVHVKFVVPAYTRAYQIVPFFLVGAEAIKVPGVTRDPYRSWFWVK
jgi:hypothetical protein